MFTGIAIGLVVVFLVFFFINYDMKKTRIDASTTAVEVEVLSVDMNARQKKILKSFERGSDLLRDHGRLALNALKGLEHESDLLRSGYGGLYEEYFINAKIGSRTDTRVFMIVSVSTHFNEITVLPSYFLV